MMRKESCRSELVYYTLTKDFARLIRFYIAQVQEIKEIYSQYLENISVSEMEGWACIHGTRKEKLDM